MIRISGEYRPAVSRRRHRRTVVAATKKKSAERKVAAAVAPKKPAAPSSAAELPVLEFEQASAWLTWLERHHATSRGVMIKLAKKSSPKRSISYQEALDGALRWGWIDGQTKPYDAHAWLRKFTPRGARSVWSKINRDKALGLIARGEMQAQGLAEVERAQRDGRWDAAYDSPRSAAVPEDLSVALAQNRRAQAFFAQLNAANRYAILWRLQTAKRAETRARRIEQFIAMLAKGEKLHP
jgi:uncharacterized protein YdeI (YjbR/CyaY-like superfamily)